MAKKQKFPYLVGSKWTAQRKVDGWRHFQVVNRKNQSKWVYAEMVAACDPNVRFWINAKLLQDGLQWQVGWQSLQGLEEDVYRSFITFVGEKYKPFIHNHI